MIFLLLIPLIILVLFAIYLFNQLIQDKNYVREGWSGIDVQLKKRHDLLPKLVMAVQAYMIYERQTLENITQLREQSISINNLSERDKLESSLGRDIHALLAKIENYPDLKSNNSITELLKNISIVEDHLQMARRYYNGAVRNYNVRTESFPSSLIAKLFQFQPAEYFQIQPEEGKNEDLSL